MPLGVGLRWDGWKTSGLDGCCDGFGITGVGYEDVVMLLIVSCIDWRMGEPW